MNRSKAIAFLEEILKLDSAYIEIVDLSRKGTLDEYTLHVKGERISTSGIVKIAIQTI